MLPLSLAADDPEQSIPLLTPDQEREMSEAALPDALPILTLRNTVLYPGVVLPITVGRDTSLQLVKDAYAGDRMVGVVAQKRAEVESPGPDDLYRVGSAATILKLIKMPDGSVSIVIQGKRRVEVQEYDQLDPYLRARIQAIDEDTAADVDPAELGARVRSIKELAVQIVNLSPNLPSEAAYAIQNIESPGFLVHFIASNLQIDVEKKQELLETRPLLDRSQLVLDHLKNEVRGLGDLRGDPVQGQDRRRPAAARVLPAPAAQGHPGRAGRGRGVVAATPTSSARRWRRSATCSRKP